MPLEPAAPRPRPRIAVRGRPFEDPGCAGCAQLPLLAALRRSGLVVEGGLGCDPRAAAPGGDDRSPLPLRTALVVGASTATDPTLLAASRARRALLVVADRGEPSRGAALAAALAEAGAAARAVRPDRAADVADALAWAAAAGPGAALVALAPCARETARAAPVSVAPSRCSRCGACLALGCVAIADDGGDAVRVDAERCGGCGLCAPLCRGHALAAAGGR